MNIEQKKLAQSQVAMTIALISWAMLFATLFLAYAIVRFNASFWPPAQFDQISLTLPILSTIVIGLSSLTYILFQAQTLNPTKNEQTLKKAQSLLVATLFLGLIFLRLQWAFWSELKSLNIYASGGILPSLIYTFTWVHAAHIVLGLCAFVWPIRLVMNKEKFVDSVSTYQNMILNVGKFWHFLGIVWLIMFVTLFIL